MTTIARMRSVVLDCPDTRALSEFYRALLGWEIFIDNADDEDGWVSLTDGGSVRLSFQRAADYRPPRWPDPEHPQQCHLDVTVDDLDAAETATLALGATKADVQPSPTEYRVMIDPAGHPFCLCVD